MTGASGRADDIRPYSFPSCFLCAFLFARQPQIICKVLFGKSIEKSASRRREAFHPQRRRVRREEKNSGAEIVPAEEFFIPLKFSGREPLGEQENLHPEKSDPSLFSEALALPMRWVQWLLDDAAAEDAEALTMTAHMAIS